MARGNIAKESVIAKMKAAFGEDWIGEYEKKFYIWAQENGERMQIAIALTCPKVPVEATAAPITGDFNFEDDAPSTVVAASGFKPAEITSDERANLVALMEKLGL